MQIMLAVYDVDAAELLESRAAIVIEVALLAKSDITPDPVGAVEDPLLIVQVGDDAKVPEVTVIAQAPDETLPMDVIQVPF